ncbi:pilus assembly protein TadG-related protein [Streptomonospora nanhaiensis]|uniref:Putative membrane protein n=1 Tax=Streptomonospora nanhaiensis TaxID=1323731 RepID=A0A853BVS8_9ACTN|nr:pilus assembly protein TadG-related protein [Streptomonospora nanhaiensis]MBV2365995.1 hypothetical protein [Streptomonospora nanhaiensis]NYI98312.1 putative membrane protein [Streptomonospora nanhaiensis]
MSPHRRNRRRGDEGRVLVLVVVLAAAIGACFGLVVDGGRMLLDKTRATTLAHEAARAGARELDTAHLAQTGRIRLDAGAAREQARAYLKAAGAQGSVHVERQQVSVVAEVPYTTRVLPLGEGIAQARASADALQN